MNVDLSKLEDVEALVERSHELHSPTGHNCAQAVACTFAPVVGADEETCFRMMEGFGIGMGGMTETCGAVSGAVAMLGFAASGGGEGAATKGGTYKIARQIPERFCAQNGSTVCKEIKGVGTGTVLRSCPDCVEDAVRILADVLREAAAE